MGNLKKSLVFLLIFVLISIPIVASNNLVVIMDGERREVMEVPIVLDGKPVYFDIPTFAKEGSTLVSLREIGEAYGAKVDWEGKNQKITVSNEGKEIVMNIGSRDVYINGELKKIESGHTPKLIRFAHKSNSNTMVPLRFLSETFGYKVGWDSKTGIPFVNTKEKEEEIRDNGIVEDFNLEYTSTGTPKIKIKGEKALKYTYKKDTNKIRVTIENGNLSSNYKGKKKFNVDKDPLKDIELKDTKDKLVIDFNLTNNTEVDIIPSNGNKDLDIYFVNRVNNIKEEKKSEKSIIVVEKDKKTDFNILKLDNPKRLVVDLMDSSFNLKNSSFSYNKSGIKSIRTSQFTAKNLYGKNDRVVRLVFDLENKANYDDIILKDQGRRLEIQSKYKEVVEKPKPVIDIKDIISYRLDGDGSNLKIDLEKNTNYDLSIENSIVTIPVPKSNIKYSEGSYYINDSIVDKVELKEGKNNVDIKIYLNTKVYVIDLTKDTNSKFIDLDIIRQVSKPDKPIEEPVEEPAEKPGNKQITIAIDPGHGGKDPGAVRAGVNEKDIILPVSLKVQKLLLDQGYNVVMTRETDKYLSLAERANIANGANADLFLSIHANSVSNAPSANGIETLYNTSLDKELARCIQEEVIKATGATDRKIKHRPNLAVLRRTKMPASLIELGFISNERERNLMTNNGYQNILAKGIVKGIEKFIENYL